MSYEKQNFVDGQTLTAAHLNHMEAGIAAAATGVKGDKGDPGPQGPKGDKGDPGDLGTATAAPVYAPSRMGCVNYADVAGCDYAQIIIYGQSLASGTLVGGVSGRHALHHVLDGFDVAIEHGKGNVSKASNNHG